MKANVYDKTGKTKGKMNLPIQFSEAHRPTIIKRAFNANMSNNYQHHSTKFRAGMTKVTGLSKRRRKYRGVYGAGRSRTPKKVMSRRGTRFGFVADKVPFARKGRAAHPPRVEKNFEEKINNKERLLAIRSAITATTNKELMIKRSHELNKEINIPIVIENSQDLNKTRKVEELMKKLGLEKELSRIRVKKIRAGKGKMRGRRYKTKKGPLIVTSKDCKLLKASKGIQGVEAVSVNNLNITLLAPGGIPGRLTIWTKEAIKELNDKKLFTGERA